MRFSVIMPLYNKAPYVSKAIESVLMQTFTNYELLVVDDGSKDESASVAAKSIEDKQYCQLIRQENAGVSMARNKGVAASHGDFLCFLDADDWWEPTFLEEMDKFVSEFPDAGIYGTNYTIINESRHKTRVAMVGVESGFEKGYINYCQVYAKTMYMPLWTGAVCITRSVFDEMQGFPQGIKLGEDFLLWIRIVLKFKVAFLDKPLSNYNQDVDGENRGVGRLHETKSHMLWNLGVLAAEEKNNPELKQLLDNLRTFSLMPYLLSNEYHDLAQQELDKVEWAKQPEKVTKVYHQPLFLLRAKQAVNRIGSSIKAVVQ